MMTKMMEAGQRTTEQLELSRLTTMFHHHFKDMQDRLTAPQVHHVHQDPRVRATKTNRRQGSKRPFPFLSMAALLTGALAAGAIASPVIQGRTDNSLSISTLFVGFVARSDDTVTPTVPVISSPSPDTKKAATLAVLPSIAASRLELDQTEAEEKKVLEELEFDYEELDVSQLGEGKA